MGSQLLQNTEINIVLHWKFRRKYEPVWHLISCSNTIMYKKIFDLMKTFFLEMNQITNSIESHKNTEQKKMNNEQCSISFFHLNYTRGSFLNFLSIFRIALKHILEKIHLYGKLSKINDESLTFSIKIHNDFGSFFKFWFFNKNTF